MCGWVGRRREHGEHLAFIDLRDHTGIVQCVVDGAADLRSEFVVRITGTVRARPEGTTNDALATGAVEVGDCTVEILSRRRAAAVPDRRARPTASTRWSGSATATSTCAASGCSATSASEPTVNSAIRGRHGAPGLRRGRDADAHAVDAGGRPRVPRAVPPGAGQLLRAARSRRSCSSSCSWSAAPTATTRSPAACATRTCAPTGSTSSCSSTSRPASSRRTRCSPFVVRGGARRRRGGARRAAR